MKILITGANGMLGSSLCQLYHNKYKVYALHRDKVCFTACSADYSLDLTDRSKVDEVFNKINPDLVVHSASLTSLERCEQNPDLAISANVLASENIARSCPAETKLVYISTDQVYGATADYFEANEALKPVNQYGKTKLLGEQKVQDLCSNHLIVRTNIFGWNVKPGRVSSAEWIYNSLKNGEKITLFTDYIFSPVYTEYLGEIIMQLVEIDFSGIINAGSSEPCSKYTFGIQLAEEFEFDKSLIKKGSIDDYDFEAPRPKNITINTQRLTLLDITPPNYEKSIKKFNRNKPSALSIR